MIPDKEQVTNALAVAVNRQSLASLCVEDCHRHQLFWEIEGALVVGAIGKDNRQTIGFKPSSLKVIGCRLGGRVG